MHLQVIVSSLNDILADTGCAKGLSNIVRFRFGCGRVTESSHSVET